jgi:hypothetical protein
VLLAGGGCTGWANAVVAAKTPVKTAIHFILLLGLARYFGSPGP